MTNKTFSLGFVLLLVPLLLASCGGEIPAPSSAVPPRVEATSMPASPPSSARATPAPGGAPNGSSKVQAKVTRVIDGDTIEVVIDGKAYTVRYIGVNTPETVDPRRPVQAFGKEASEKNKELVEGQTVQLEKDVSETDRYGRLLRYVYVGDLIINAELVRLGYAQASAYPPDVKYQDFFSELEREAREEGRGFWASEPVPPEAPAPVTPTPTPQLGGNCDPAYPDFCIPPPPPDLDCKDISRKRFRVLPPDPHRLDSDRDGIGCES